MHQEKEARTTRSSRKSLSEIGEFPSNRCLSPQKTSRARARHSHGELEPHNLQAVHRFQQLARNLNGATVGHKGGGIQLALGHVNGQSPFGKFAAKASASC